MPIGRNRWLSNRHWPAKAVVGREGDPLGRIGYIYLDRIPHHPDT
jgi:hypothetical protein